MKVKIIVALFILPILIPAVSAQFDVPEWELGWDTNMETTYELQLDVDDWDLEEILVLYVDNERSSEVNIELTIELSDEDFPVEIDAPESVSVSGGSNDTIEISITSISDEVKVREYSPTQAVTITVTADEVVAGSGQSRSTQEIEGDLRLSKEHKLDHEIQEQNIELKAGTFIEVTLLVHNLGNHQDAIKDSSYTVRMCPHLDVEQLDSAEDIVLKTTGQGGELANPHEFTIRVKASSSASSKTCEVSISLTSEGSGESYTNSFDVEVDAVESDDGTQNDQSSTDEDEPIISTEPNSTPFLGLIEIIALLGVIGLTSRKRC